MVGISARFIPHHSSSPEKIGEVGCKEDEEESSTTTNGVLRMDNCEMIIETEINFKPIEHPPEPPEDDQPIKCPIPDNLPLIVEAECEEPSTESQSLQTIAELLEEEEKEKEKEESSEKSFGTGTGTGTDTGTDNNESHNDISRNAVTPTHKSPHHKILDLFQQCKDLSA